MNQKDKHNLALWLVAKGNEAPESIYDCIAEQVCCEMIVTGTSPSWKLICEATEEKKCAS